MEFEYFGFSDSGSVRDHNEDSYLCNEKERLFLVADGMGGHASGETASKLAVDCIEDFVIRSRADDFKWPIEYRKDLSIEQNRLLAAALFGNLKIREIAEQNSLMKGMGTTLIGGIIEGDNLAVVNVGDSRLYRVRDGKIKQITEDQSLVGEQERNGMLTREEARQHPQRHVLTSALGHIKDKSKIDIFLTGIMEKDLYLICTDGLYSMLDDSELLSIINSIEDRSLYKMGLSLTLKANLAGGLDNITVVLLFFNSLEEM
ncbi:MAG: serine/threonine-protein phosphatase [Deltaproteobacteria bacterium]|nr:serine/threonine-protein phosphatase [Deltaproteobacteria bacterium]